MCTMYPNWVHSLHYLSSFLSPFKTISLNFNVPYLYIWREHINHIHSPLSSSFTPPLVKRDMFYILGLHCSVEVCLGILHGNTLYLTSLLHLLLFLTLFYLSHLVQQFSVCFVPIQMWCISILLTIILFFPSFPLVKHL
jgi:hypothetical protein